MELGHDAGGARIELSRKKICSTTIAWPQFAHTKVGAGAVDASSAGAFGGGGGAARFGACRAYNELVMRRIAELRESRLPGVQTIEEFMSRRFTPAVATCNTAAQRLVGLSERVARASNLLSTRVDIARERQNQALLTQMNRRARLQLRLQQTVEGLSVAAIVYYAAGLVGYVSKGLKAGGLKLEPDLLVGTSVPVLEALAILAVRRARRHAAEDAAP